MATKYCPHCGAGQPSEAEFCGVCGGAFYPQSSPEPKRKIPWLWFIVGGALLIFCSLSSWLIVSYQEDMLNVGEQILVGLPPELAAFVPFVELTPTPDPTSRPDPTPELTSTPLPTASDIAPSPEVTEPVEASLTPTLLPTDEIGSEPTNDPSPEPTSTGTPTPTNGIITISGGKWRVADKIFIGAEIDESNFEMTTSFSPLTEGFVMTGIGGRVFNDRFTTLHVQVAPIDEDGLVDESREEILYYGSDPFQEVEAGIFDLPDQHVVVGVGMRVDKIAGADDPNLETLVVYSRELNPETGRLNREIVEHRAGRQADASGLEIDCHPQHQDRVSILTGIGVTVSNYNIISSMFEFGSLGEMADGRVPTPDLVRGGCG